MASQSIKQLQLHHHFQQSKLDYAQTSKTFLFFIFFFSVNPHLYLIMPMLHGSPLLYPGLVGTSRRLQAIFLGTKRVRLASPNRGTHRYPIHAHRRQGHCAALLRHP